MKALLVVAHGSRRLESNYEVRELLKNITNLEHDFFEIKAAFLELAEPLIPDGIRQLIKNGAKEVIVMPYFLSAGRHGTQDMCELFRRNLKTSSVMPQ
jgi:sirohydrochlorin ferrochelatase